MDLDSLYAKDIDLSVYDNLQIAFNDGTGILKTADGQQVAMGKTVQWKMQPMVKEDTTTKYETIGKIWLALISLALTISFFLALFQGSLLPTWMLINSLQLIAHVPLIASQLPANAHYFLLNLLSLVRLNFESLNTLLDDAEARLQEYQLLSDSDSYYTSQLHNSGYRYRFARNMLTILCLAALVALVWVIMSLFEAKCRNGQNRRTRRESVSVLMSNFTVRFLYELFFEIFLCALINVSAFSVGAANGNWVISLFMLLACAAAIGFMASLYCKNGPYLADSYQKGSFLSSFWEVRQLSADVQMQAVQTDDKTSRSPELKEGVKEQAPVAFNSSNSNTHTMFHSNVPLNQ